MVCRKIHGAVLDWPLQRQACTILKVFLFSMPGCEYRHSPFLVRLNNCWHLMARPAHVSTIMKLHILLPFISYLYINMFSVIALTVCVDKMVSPNPQTPSPPSLPLLLISSDHFLLMALSSYSLSCAKH